MSEDESPQRKKRQLETESELAPDEKQPRLDNDDSEEQQHRMSSPSEFGMDTGFEEPMALPMGDSVQQTDTTSSSLHKVVASAEELFGKVDEIDTNETISKQSSIATLEQTSASTNDALNDAMRALPPLAAQPAAPMQQFAQALPAWSFNPYFFLNPTNASLNVNQTSINPLQNGVIVAQQGQQRQETISVDQTNNTFDSISATGDGTSQLQTLNQQAPPILPSSAQQTIPNMIPGIFPQMFLQQSQFPPQLSLPQNQNQFIMFPPPRNDPPPQRRGVDMSLACDKDHLSEYQVLVRQQLEMFEAMPEDVDSSTQGRKKQVFLGQVGLRCKHCVAFPLRARSRGAVYYPAKLSNVYQAAQNMAVTHLCDACQQVPAQIREDLLNLRDQRGNATGGKQYWADSCKALGCYESEGGIRLGQRLSS